MDKKNRESERHTKKRLHRKRVTWKSSLRIFWGVEGTQAVQAF
jgi:hypothetical protein